VQHGIAARLYLEGAVPVLDGQDRATEALRQLRRSEALAVELAAHPDLLQGEVGAVVAETVEEGGDGRACQQLGDAAAADGRGGHHVVRPRSVQLHLVLDGARPCQDGRRRGEPSGGQRDHDVVRVGVDGRDDRAGAGDAGLGQGGIDGRVTDDVRRARRLEDRRLPRILLHDDVLEALAREPVHDLTPRASVTADDHVIVQLVDHLVHPSPLDVAAEVSLDQELRAADRAVGDRPDAGDQQAHGEGPADGVELDDLGVADRRDGDHRHVRRIER
jgi:hypothetical protein